MDFKKLEYIWYSRLDIGINLKTKLLEEFGSLDEFYNCSLDDLVYFNVGDKEIFKILDFELKNKLEKEYEYLAKNNIGILGIEDNEYPEKLRNIKDSPKVLFYKGNLNIINDDAIGIVGSRVALKESLELSREISKDISSLGINIVSGLALGIDKYAHLGCMDLNNGKTIAVLRLWY